jgi:hypothetical protein
MEAIKQYFPLQVAWCQFLSLRRVVVSRPASLAVLQTVTDNMFGIYERLLGLKFEQVEFSDAFSPWHPEVTLFAVLDNTGDAGEGESPPLSAAKRVLP